MGEPYPTVSGDLALAPQERIERLRDMVRIRRFEEACRQTYAEGRIRGFLHLYNGEEACAVGALAPLGPDDVLVATYREHAHALQRGVPMAVVFAELFGFVEGCAHGRGGSMHLFDRKAGLYGGNAIVAAGLPVAVGVALAGVLRGEHGVTMCVFGDGAAAEGAFHESLNLAALWRLPLLFVCENNGYAMGTAVDRALSGDGIVGWAQRYGMAASTVDGMDVEAVEAAARQAVDRIRAEAAPVFLELRTYRFAAHSMFDPQRYRTDEEIEQHRQRDPILVQSRRLIDEGLLDEHGLAVIQAAADREVVAALAEAERGHREPVGDLMRFVSAEDAGA